MDQLIGPNVQVVLGLEEGKGFDGVENPLGFVATLSNLSLDTDFINPEPCPQFTTNLVWEATKISLRKMRSAQEPLKVECFEFKENGVKDRIGYMILSLRSAQVVPRSSNINIKKNWHRLLGLRSDLKSTKPEILLSLIIEERIDQEVDGIDSPRKNLDSTRTIEANEDPIPHLIPDEGLIQLGPIETCQDLFLLNVIAQTVGNIHRLEATTLIRFDDDQRLTFWYRILENNVQSKPFYKDGKIWSLDEKIVIRIRSSYSILKNYLERRSNFQILLKNGGRVLGEASMDLSLLLGNQSEAMFLKNSINGMTVLNERCFIKNLGSKDETFHVNERPFLDLQLQLQYLGTKSFNTVEVGRVDEIHIKSTSSNKLPERNLYSEDVLLHKFCDTDRQRDTIGDGVHMSTDRMDFFPTCGIPQLHPEQLIHTCEGRVQNPSLDSYHCYCLHVKVNSIKLISGLSVKSIEFRFHHPKAGISSTMDPKIPVLSGEILRLHNICSRLQFVSSADEIRPLLLTFPPKISICDGEKTENCCIGETYLDVRRLFDKAELESPYCAQLFNHQREEIGLLEISMQLEDLGPYYRRKKQACEENLGPPILDDKLAYKIVDELETWKERQQEIFRAELKRREERHLDRLSEEWKKCKESLESQLSCSIEQCKILTDDLNSATNDLRTRRLQTIEKEAKLIKMNEEMKWSYERKFQELKDVSDKLQKDFQEKLTKLEEIKENLEAQLSPLKARNEELEKILKQQSEEFANHQKVSVVQDETQNLLHSIKKLEKQLETAMKSKSFYKEHYYKAIREINKIKNERHQALEVQIKSSRNELSQRNLEDILHLDFEALNNDKVVLSQVQKTVDVLKPQPSFSLDLPNEFIVPTALNSCSRSQVIFDKPQSSSRSNRPDTRLQKLTDERESLLKTGSYTANDAIIVKLNSEIRSILLSS